MSQSDLNIEREIISASYKKREIFESEEDEEDEEKADKVVDIDKIIQENTKIKKANILDSSIKQIHSFNLSTKTTSEINQNVNYILEKVKEGEDVFVPLRMSVLKQEIRNDKKQKIIEAFKGLDNISFTRKTKNTTTHLPEMAILEEE